MLANVWPEKTMKPLKQTLLLPQGRELKYQIIYLKISINALTIFS